MKKKSFIVVLLLGSILLSCNNKQSSTSNKSTSPKTEEKEEMPDGWAMGKGSEYAPETKAEHNLVNQSDTYQAALFLGNVEEMKSFFYKESLEYYKKYFPELSQDEILDEFLSMMSSDVMKMLREYEDKGIVFSLYIEDIVREVEYGNDLLYVYTICGRMEGYKNDTLTYLHTTNPDLTLGISHNKGKNWTFMAMTNEVPSILRMYYPQSVINEVMGY